MNNQPLNAKHISEHDLALSFSIAALPPNIGNVMFMHLVQKKDLHQVAAETGHPPHLVQRWLHSGTALLQVFDGTYNNQKPSSTIKYHK